MDYSSQEHWFYMFPQVFVSHGKNGTMLLYNTKDNNYIETDNTICSKLVTDVYSPLNLGVIVLTSEFTNSQECCTFIDHLLEKGMGKIIEKEKGVQKPINLLPILNLQKDVEKLAALGGLSMGKALNRYLSEINLYINDVCHSRCNHCNTYYQQTRSCLCESKQQLLHPNTVDEILSQITSSLIKHVNILGGNILLYPYWNELQEILRKYDFKYHYWINYLHLGDIKNTIDADSLPFIEVLVNISIENNQELQSYLVRNKNSPNLNFHFLTNNERQCDLVTEFTLNNKLTNFSITPIFTGDNLKFFTQNIFMDKSDIFSTLIEQRKIFCHQKLNTHYFGVLNILPSGSIKANLCTCELGNIYKNTIIEAIYEEMKKNTAWRKIRDAEPCDKCLYQYLCPSPSNYELVIGKPNLCHVKP